MDNNSGSKTDNKKGAGSGTPKKKFSLFGGKKANKPDAAPEEAPAGGGTAAKPVSPFPKPLEILLTCVPPLALILLAFNTSFCYRIFVAWREIGKYALSLVFFCVIFYVLSLLICLTAKKRMAFKKALLRSLIGTAVFIVPFMAILLIYNNLLNAGTKASDAMTLSLVYMCVLALVYLCILFYRISKFDSRVYLRVSAGLCVFLLLSAEVGYKLWDRKTNIKAYSDSGVTFASLSLSDAAVSDQEKADCRDWFDKYIVSAGTNGVAPAYEFVCGGVDLQKDFASFKFSAGDTSSTGDVYKGGKTTEITVTNDAIGLKAVVEATIYEDLATCSWTVHLQNTGTGNSGTVSDFCSLNAVLDSGMSSTMYYSAGSDYSMDDFKLYSKKIGLMAMNFSGTGGRSSDQYMPYFNINGSAGSFVLAVGWSGQWEADFKRSGYGTRTVVKQQEFSAYLEPGEQVRSPLTTLSFYKNENAMKGFNLFRRFMAEDMYDNDQGTAVITSAAPNEAALAEGDATVDSVVSDIKTKGLADKFDYVWYDAGWFFPQDKVWSETVGTWTADAQKFPDGMSYVSSAFKTVGTGLLLWYEPERVYKDSDFYNKYNGTSYLLARDGETNNYLYNLADDDACKALCEYMTTSLKENGVTFYRQDFNIEPLSFWQENDAKTPGRTGITENHYITNLYVYWDYLLKNIPGLKIDCCASGGRRLDIELMRRSVPLWRSDYQCDQMDNDTASVSLQDQTYGLSLWIPLSCSTNHWADDRYEYRSFLTPIAEIPSHLAFDDTDEFNNYYDLYNSVKSYFTGSYYPLTAQNYSQSDMIAMEFESSDGQNGCVLVYQRKDYATTNVSLKLSGLDESSDYVISDYDSSSQRYTKSGKELMNTGFSIPDGTGSHHCYVYMFTKK